MFMMIKRLYSEFFLKRFDPERYAREVGVTIGAGCKLIRPNFGSEPWLIRIGNHVEVTGGVKFITHDGATWVFRDQEKYKKVRKFGIIDIKDNCFIGLNSIILPGVTIGPNSVVGAGSIVNRDVPPNTVVAGNPARTICSLEEYADKCLASSPEYDEQLYKQDRKQEILRMLTKQ